MNRGNVGLILARRSSARLDVWFLMTWVNKKRPAGRFLLILNRSLADRIAEFPFARHHFLKPETADDRLYVADMAAFDPFENLRPLRNERLQKLALVELVLARGQSTSEIQIDKFGRIRNHGMNPRQEKPFACRVTRFF